MLSDPLKDSSRTQESWNAFLTKLRTLLLMSFTKNLGKFEDDMRTLREKRTEPGWSFCDYFMVQVPGWWHLLLSEKALPRVLTTSFLDAEVARAGLSFPRGRWTVLALSTVNSAEGAAAGTQVFVHGLPCLGLKDGLWGHSLHGSAS